MSISIRTTDDRFRVRSHYDHKLKEALKSIDGRRWNPEERTWDYPATPAGAHALAKRLKENAYPYTADDAFVQCVRCFAEAQRSVSSDEEPTDISGCKTEPFKHQKVAFWKMARMFGDAIPGIRQIRAAEPPVSGAGFYVAHPMGIGKSKVCVDYIFHFNLHPILIVCPKSVIQEWPRQFDAHGHNDSVHCVPLLKGSVARRLKEAEAAMDNGPCTLVINYDAVWREPFYTWALEQKWAMVIADELHRCQESRTRISKFMHKLRNTTPRRVGLSGTPIPNNPLNLWSQCKFLDPGLLGESFVAFRARYAIMGGYKQKEVVAFRNLDDLNRRFYQIAHRVELKDAIDLPETMDEERSVELSKHATEIYTEIETSFVARIQEGTINVSNALTELLRLQQLTGGAAAVQEREKPVEVDHSKAEALADLFKDLPKDEPVVVFCRFHHDLDVVQKTAEAAGRTCAELSGRVNELDAWRDPGATSPTVLAVQIKTGGLGIDLTKACYATYYSLGFSLAEYEQSRARLHRKGQARKVTYYHLLAKKSDGRKTIDHKVYAALQSKQKVVEKILKEALDS